MSDWSAQAAEYLLDASRCPRCNARLGAVPVCGACGADLRGEVGAGLYAASERAAHAVLERARLVAAVPVLVADERAEALGSRRVVERADVSTGPSAASAPSRPAPAPAAAAAAVAVAPVAPGAASQISVQSVLAVAGAGLLAIAAIVFTFLNPDVGFGMRTLVIALVTAGFLGGALLLQRRGVQFSAEALGALGMVFLALDVQAFTEAGATDGVRWALGGVGSLLAAGTMVVAARAARIRTWLWLGLVWLALVPAMFGYSGGGWFAAWGHVGVVAVAALAIHVLGWFGLAFGSALRAERVTLGVLQFAAVGVVLLQLPFLWSPSNALAVLGRAALLAILAVLAVVTARRWLRRTWSAFAGVLAAAAAALVPFAWVSLTESPWLVAVVPLAAGIVLVATGWVRSSEWVAAAQLRTGVLVVLLASALPAVNIAFFAGGISLLDSVFRPYGAARLLASESGADLGLAALLGLAAASAAVIGHAFAVRRVDPAGHATSLLTTGLWLGAAAAAAFAGWTGIGPVWRVVIVLVGAAAATLLVLVPGSRVARAGARLRAPFVVFAQVAVGQAVLLSWIDADLTVPVGIAAVAVLLIVARPFRSPVRVVHHAVAYAYALVVLATALDRAGLELIPVLTLVTSAGALFALAATLTPRVDARNWYAVLGVTSVPFLIGVGSVLVERSAWTALSTGLIFLLAFTLVLTRRVGLSRLVRAGAAALLVPALSVVVVSLAAGWFAQSGSPIALPVIAGIVAVAVPATPALTALLVRRGRSEQTGSAVRVAIESSSLVTAVIAVLLSLVREASGLGTTTAVLVILGLGGAAASVFAGRRYGWWAAAAAWTGALWCLLALNGVAVLEPYTLPPALAAVVVGVIAVARRGSGGPLVASGLAAAIVPSVVLVATGAAGAEVRVWALFAAAAVLTVAGGWLGGRWLADSGHIARLRTTALVAAIGASAALPFEAIRWASGVDLAPGVADEQVMLPVLGISVLAAAVAAVAGSLLRRGGERGLRDGAFGRKLAASGWTLAPAFVFLVAGPIFAVRVHPFPIWTLWGLMTALLLTSLASVVLARRGAPLRGILPPFWFVYGVAWITGVAGWSARELRVEVFSLPLGLAVLAAGIIGMGVQREASARRSLDSWPLGFTRSWWLLGPGIALTVLPSILATGTDPQLYRPIMVIGLALVAILVGATRKLAAPFILGLAVLPLENVVVFAAQLDRTVGAMPWWITLATAGGVLLAIAVGSEGRANQGRGVVARMRELR
ncbi:hypothetical protein ET445_03380 [Agromyces protaetiae]|uniref:Uncharacterized protein n=1 Tax=Agromyces protaetiae TaxID=2509455 RepID=A0A4P6FA71_9MICO|nr:hypothetical protein [Agromyces protaetiae]QAY72525.1 hypothetical protein ET445_03380 [Agromyces protaetiae]